MTKNRCRVIEVVWILRSSKSNLIKEQNQVMPRTEGQISRASPEEVVQAAGGMRRMRERYHHQSK